MPRATGRGFGVIVAASLVLATATSARAQSTDTGLPDTRSVQTRSGPPTLVFVLPGGLDQERRGALADAIGTQLALIEVRLVLLDGPSTSEPPELEQRVTRSVELATEHHALGVLWLDVRPTDHWFLYAMDEKAERVVVRPLLVRRESVAAGIEEVGVITRACAESLLHGEPVSGEPVPVTPAPPPPPSAAEPKPVAPPAPSSPPTDRIRIALAYRGETFASSLPWQSGASFGASYLWAKGPYAGASFTWFPAHEFGDGARFSVQRRPLALLGGFRFDVDRRLSLDAELAAVADIRSRHTLSTSPGAEPRPDRTRLLFSVSPTVRLELAIAPWLGVFVAASLDVLFNEFDYLSAPNQTDPELYPYRARPGGSFGVAFLQ